MQALMPPVIGEQSNTERVVAIALAVAITKGLARL